MPLRPYDLATEKGWAESQERMRASLEAKRADFKSEKAFQEFVDYAVSRQAAAEFQPISRESLEPSEIEGVPVIAADEVGAYCRDLPLGYRLGDLVTVLAPPFDEFFVEVQGVAHELDLHSWGVLVRQCPGFSWDDERPDEVGWKLQLTLVIEKRKGNPIGPVATFLMGLDREGLWARHDDGGVVWAGKLVDFDPPAPAETTQESTDTLVPFIAPALFAVSLMHCKNVTARTASPTPALSKKWRKRQGKPLTRYHVLEIAPMREVLDTTGEAGTKGLGHALHICRGHFKTFTEDAPLFGRVTGQFWWASQVRGKAKHGKVSKDYRIAMDGGDLGRTYRPANETPDIARTSQSGPDPDIAGRGLQAHNTTQNALAEAVTRAGYDPRSPSPDEPDYDLAWLANEAVHVAEVKSITAENEERQLRIAIGQVVRYRHQLAADEDRRVQAVIALERHPYDETWLDLCNRQGIILAWPEVMDLIFNA